MRIVASREDRSKPCSNAGMQGQVPGAAYSLPRLRWIIALGINRAGLVICSVEAVNAFRDRVPGRQLLRKVRPF